MENSQASPVRLLIVDDDEAMRILCGRFFQRSPPARGIEITEAESGERAVELLAEREFDCILCDYRMGAVTGIDVLVFARMRRPKAIRIMMTGFENGDLRSEAEAKARPDDFFEKPMTSGELEQVLKERVLDRYLKVLPARDPATP